MGNYETRAGALRMILTIFRSRLRSGAHEYSNVAKEMLDLAQAMPGFVSFKTFSHADGERCSVVLFFDWESHNAWANHPRHTEVQRQGREEFYSEYSISVAEVAHAYDFHNEQVP
jgi:heme-degrading monooxygenase HmoA